MGCAIIKAQGCKNVSDNKICENAKACRKLGQKLGVSKKGLNVVKNRVFTFYILVAYRPPLGKIGKEEINM